MTAVADPLDDPFLGIALEAFLAEARAVRGWPDPEATRRRACRLYEDSLAGGCGRAQSPLDKPCDPW
ncbi:MAG: hypothetical protein U0871_25320 [Gemmataceae bacterium]